MPNVREKRNIIIPGLGIGKYFLYRFQQFLILPLAPLLNILTRLNFLRLCLSGSQLSTHFRDFFLNVLESIFYFFSVIFQSFAFVDQAVFLIFAGFVSAFELSNFRLHFLKLVNVKFIPTFRVSKYIPSTINTDYLQQASLVGRSC